VAWPSAEFVILSVAKNLFFFILVLTSWGSQQKADPSLRSG
jgi:hypothetical protein